MGVNEPSEDDVYDYGLYLLNGILRQTGHSLQDFALPMPRHQWDLQLENSLIAEQLNYNIENERDRARVEGQMFNAEQAAAFQRIFESARDNLGKRFFLNGPGGTGKTFV
jgi:SpoVK/Ycf46/Vps4 family AAA+-type ATPase